MSSDVVYFPNSLRGAADELRSVDETTQASASLVHEKQVRVPVGRTSPRLIAARAETTDEEVVGQICSGSSEALAILFQRYARMVRTLSYRILRDQAEADDLVQEVFLFVFRKAGLFDPKRGSAVSWLVQVTYHRAFDRRRYLRARGFYSHCELDEALLQPEDPRVQTLRYDDTIEAALGQDALCRIEASLSDVQRRVLRLRFFDGHTMEEIAAILGQSPGNVRNHYYRALEKMRREVFAGQLKSK